VAARAFAFSPVELEEQEELLWDRPTHALKGPSPSLQALTERLATCESFKVRLLRICVVNTMTEPP
jgi:hypothetical protein